MCEECLFQFRLDDLQGCSPEDGIVEPARPLRSLPCFHFHTEAFDGRMKSNDPQARTFCEKAEYTIIAETPDLVSLEA